MSRDVLLAIGVTLFVLGIILRGIAREHGRTLASRKLHDLDTRKSGEPPPPELSHLDQHLSTYATVIAVVGAIVAIVAFLR